VAFGWHSGGEQGRLLAENIKSIYQNDLKPEGNSGKCIANSKQNNVLKKYGGLARPLRSNKAKR
jgi:hypothetical protein